MNNSKNWIYTIIEHIYNDNQINIYHYTKLELAINNFENLKKYYKENYWQYLENEKQFLEKWTLLDIYDIACIELYFDEDLNKEIKL